ncbi:uncharacterized protein LOC133726913 isoform X1 [Rosa rugosa]|uniref:uncharacterized protein LOC133726913 isoform X1 n=2 Tax=Rosa rugosa TaxID=74645 RepID=UPI002B40B8AF|nr:uncharacterized protein LOC133726913 isoform X1 [Rosa rugosa]
MEKKRLWVPTIVAQVCLCFGLYLAFQLGQPQNSVNLHRRSESRDLYFISVRGGFRPLKQQTHLLKRMEKVAKKYKAKFVVDISDLGKDDPLMQNGTLHFSSLKVPWYTTTVSGRYGGGYFQKQIRLPYEKTLDLIGVDTGSLEGKVLISGSSSEFGFNQLHWLTRTLEETSSDWCIVVGFHPLAKCEDSEEGMEAKQVFESLHHSFMKYEVNAYISERGCTSDVQQGTLSYIGNPGSTNALAFVNETSIFRRELEVEFLLHRVSSLEIVTYFVSLSGEVVHKSVLHQKGKAVM